jgi:HEAT repeat protein
MRNGRLSGIAGSKGETPLSSLRRALKDSNARVRTQAVRAIGYMGPDAAEAAQDLVRIMAEGVNVAEAVDALREIGEAAVQHILELIERDENLGAAATEALRAIGSPSVRAK